MEGGVIGGPNGKVNDLSFLEFDYGGEKWYHKNTKLKKDGGRKK